MSTLYIYLNFEAKLTNGVTAEFSPHDLGIGLCSAPNAASGEDMASVVLAVWGPGSGSNILKSHMFAASLHVDMLEISGCVATWPSRAAPRFAAAGRFLD